MKKHWNIAAALAAAGVLSACGNNGSSSGEEEDTTESQEESGSEEETKTITDPTGRDVEMPASPDKVVALQNVAEMIILEEEPIGTTSYYLDTYEDDLDTEETENVGDDMPDVEKVSGLEPDLIIISDYQADSLENLEKIAPVYMTAFGATPEEQLADITEVLGKQDAEEEWMTQFEENAEEAQSLIEDAEEADSQAAVIQFYGKELYIHDRSIFEGLYTKAGVEPSPGVLENEETQAVSLETIADYTEGADHLFILTENGESTEDAEELVNTLLQDTEAVENEQYYYVDNTKWSDFSLKGQEYQMKDAVEKITGSPME
ncbi:ABC-type Fe3+-hydroxamate transport system substrate-binding protein [Sinobaca qinghaiensis]|uniref:ABC-type Fe3+-hydroxamate transport system substrate-binding protein n=1 Tax=Sinobaca qinghaiensis TaxID=342944 RepID=A0A419UWF4_9BACL|nr:ABC transporter substrate-binding protein [Sinobaca qinghaiensis]RKD69460.1 ABC-type Fe3+-hydroxamate transport system substrate-binding protein [Sinobaca qinghaiensis]